MSEVLPFLKTYMDTASERLQALWGRPLTASEQARLLHVTETGYRDKQAVIVNAHRQVRVPTSLAKVADWMHNRKPHAPIITGHGTMFRPHEEYRSTVGDMVSFLLAQRKVLKNRMFDLMREGRPPEDAEVKALDQGQKIYKLLAVSFYGAYGEKGFHFYNDALGPAVTFTGQLIIASTLYGFESFMMNNLWLRNPNEMARHVAICVGQCEGGDPREEWGDHPQVPEVTPEMVVDRLIDASAPGWDSRTCAEGLVVGLPESALWAILFRGNPFQFLGFPRAQELLITALNGKISEADPGKMEKHHPEGKLAIEALWEGMSRWVAIHWMPADMPRLIGEMTRRVVILTDTDSTFLNLLPWMEWLRASFELPENDEDQMLTCLNVMVYLLRLVSDFQMGELTKNLGVPEDKRRMINFKSEFVISRMVLTNGKKNYVALEMYQEGARIVGDKVTLKGLSMKKTTVAKSTGEFLKESIETKILRSKDIDRVGVLRDLVTLEDTIREQTLAGVPEYSSPATLGRMSEYADKYAMPVVRGALAYNVAEPEMPIREGDRVAMYRTVVNTDVGRLAEEIAKHEPGTRGHEALSALLTEFFGDNAPEEMSKNGFNWFCIPKDAAAIPDYMLPLIDVESVLQANSTPMHPILEAIGIRVSRASSVDSYSNIIRF